MTAGGLRSLGLLTAAAVISLGLAPAAGLAAGRPVGPAPAPRPMVVAQRLADSLSGDPGTVPPADPATAVTRTEAQAQAQVAAAGDTSAACNGTSVVTSVTGSGAATRVVIKGSSFSFSIGAISTSWWRSPPVTTPVWLMYFRGLMWEQNVARLALSNDDDVALDLLVADAAASVASNPDPGTATWGWDEGTNLRRQQSLNCLYRASDGDQRLVPAIVATARANMDMTRYYGLPHHLPHNHGLMANLALLDAGELLGQSTWTSVAVHRLVTDSSGAFTAGGVSIEQSAGYHVMNAGMWSLVADTLASYPEAAVSGAAPAIRATVARAGIATAYLTDPRGHLVPYGDGNDAIEPVRAQARGVFRDDAAGLLTGRWSWSDQRTSYYLLRYGPPRWGHGHDDRGELVWTTLGVPVLIDPGDFSYDPGPYNTFQSSAIGHNVQLVSGRSIVSTIARLGGTTSSGSVHAYTVVDSLYGVAHVRSWRIDDARHQVTLTDRTAVAALTTLHLDLSWTLVGQSADHRTLTLRHAASGRVATVRSSSPMTVYRQSTRPPLGWQFPASGQRWGAVQVIMRPAAGTSTIVVTVS